MKFAEFLKESVEVTKLEDLTETKPTNIYNHTYKDLPLAEILFTPSKQKVFSVDARDDAEDRYKDLDNLKFISYYYSSDKDAFYALFDIAYFDKDSNTVNAGLKYSGKFDGKTWEVTFVDEYASSSKAIESVRECVKINR